MPGFKKNILSWFCWVLLGFPRFLRDAVSLVFRVGFAYFCLTCDVATAMSSPEAAGIADVQTFSAAAHWAASGFARFRPVWLGFAKLGLLWLGRCGFAGRKPGKPVGTQMHETRARLVEIPTEAHKTNLRPACLRHAGICAGANERQWQMLSFVFEKTNSKK